MKVVKYVLGVLFILGGIGSLASGAFGAGLLTAILGALFLPPVSDALKEKFKFWQNKAVRYVSYVVLFFIAGAFIPKDVTSTKTSEQKIERNDVGNVTDFKSKKDILIKYIKKDTTDKSVQNLRKMGEIGELFNNGNYSTIHPHDGYISEQVDSVTKKKILVFNPRYDFEDAEIYLKKDSKNGIIKDYIINFDIDSTGNITSKKTIITYSKTGEVEYDNDEIPALSTLIDEEVVNSRKEIKAMEKQALKQKEEHEKRMRKFEEKCLSSWNGSHRELVKLVKQNMNNPKSFEHVETRYGVTGDYAGIVMVYRGTNAFGAIVTNSIKAKVSLDDCSLISVEE